MSCILVRWRRIVQDRAANCRPIASSDGSANVEADQQKHKRSQLVNNSRTGKITTKEDKERPVADWKIGTKCYI